MSYAHLGSLRNLSQRWLIDTCTIEKQDLAKDVFGAPVVRWTTVAMGVKCRVITAGRQVQSQVQEIGAQETLRDMFKISMPAGTEVDVDYRITVNDVTYSVVQIEGALTDEFFRQVIAIRYRGSGDG